MLRSPSCGPVQSTLNYFAPFGDYCSSDNAALLLVPLCRITRFTIYNSSKAHLLLPYLIFLHQCPQVEHIGPAVPRHSNAGLCIFPSGGIAAIQLVTCQTCRVIQQSEMMQLTL